LATKIDRGFRWVGQDELLAGFWNWNAILNTVATREIGSILEKLEDVGDLPSVTLEMLAYR
jgi:hypothetical protein